MIAVIYGEGGSGGALALATSNRVWMFEHAIYAMLSPEGFASILFKDAKRADEAATYCLTDRTAAHVVDRVIPEMDNHTALLRTTSIDLKMK